MSEEKKLTDEVNYLLNEEYKLRGEPLYLIAEKITQLRCIVENPNISASDRFKVVAKFMKIIEIIISTKEIKR